MQARAHQPVATAHAAGGDGAHLGLALGIHQHHELALGARLHGALRHAVGVLQLRLLEAHMHELPRQQLAPGIGKQRTHGHRAGLRIDRQIGEHQLARQRIDAAVFLHQFELGLIGLMQLAAGDGRTQAQHVAVALGEVDVNGVDLFYGRQMAGLVLADQCTFGDQGAADAPGNRRRHTRVFQIDVGARQRRLGLQQLHLGLVELLLTHRLALQQRGVAIDGPLHDLHIDLGRDGRGLVVAVIDLEQRLSLLDFAAFGKQAFFQDALHACAHLGRAHRLQAAGQILGERGLSGRGHHDIHHGRRHAGTGAARRCASRTRLAAFAAGGQGEDAKCHDADAQGVAGRIAHAVLLVV